MQRLVLVLVGFQFYFGHFSPLFLLFLPSISIVRQAAGLLHKVVNSLTINVTDLLIRQKPVTVGFGKMELFMDSPMSPVVLADTIYKHW